MRAQFHLWSNSHQTKEWHNVFRLCLQMWNWWKCFLPGISFISISLPDTTAWPINLLRSLLPDWNYRHVRVARLNYQVIVFGNVKAPFDCSCMCIWIQVHPTKLVQWFLPTITCSAGSRPTSHSLSESCVNECWSELRHLVKCPATFPTHHFDRPKTRTA